MALGSGDTSLLKEILRLGSALENEFAPEGSTRPSASLKQNVQELIALIRKAEHAESSDFARLAKWAEHLTPEMSARHFLGILVPFERLAQKNLRDDEIIPVEENDFERDTSKSKLPLIVILENIRSAFNVGAVFRTSECWGVEKIVLSGYTPDPQDEKTAKTSMGTSQLVLWSRANRTGDAITELKSQGYSIVALETVASAPEIQSFEFPKRVALLLGNERFGLDPDSLKQADHICRIPVRGQKNSLNVGIAYGITAYEFFRQSNERA
jgi:23S rRNA (guanosine2251-2'-O)-methyltransferase